MWDQRLCQSKPLDSVSTEPTTGTQGGMDVEYFMTGESNPVMLSLPRMRQRIWGHGSQCLPLSAPRHGDGNSCWVWPLFLSCIIRLHTYSTVVCLAQTQSCCVVIVCGINGFACIWVGRWVDAWHEMCCFSLFVCICSFRTHGNKETVKSHSTHRSKFQTTYGLGLLQAYMNTIKSSSGCSVTQG